MGSATALDPYERALRAYWAPRLDLDRWWPGRSRWEVIVGAILVQNTAWTNVAKAIATLRAARRLSRARLGGLTEAELGALIRSSGFWRQKSRCLRGFALWLSNAHRGSLRRLFAQPTFEVRRQLLALPGIGPETADAILLFAGGHPSFILDNYTRRIFQRHRLPAERAWIEAALPPASGARAEPAWRGSSRARAGALGPAPINARRYRHLHAMLVETAKRFCHKQTPDCAHCPLASLLPVA